MNPLGRGRGIRDYSAPSLRRPGTTATTVSGAPPSVSDVTLTEQLSSITVSSHRSEPRQDIIPVLRTGNSGKASTGSKGDGLKSSESDYGTRMRPFPVRPSYGQLGRPIRLLSNFFPLKFAMIAERTNVYHYDVDINQLRGQGDTREEVIPDDLDRNSKRYKKLRGKVNILIIEQAVREFSNPGQMFHGIIPVFDGSRNLYTAKPIVAIADNPMKLHRVKVTVDVNGRDESYAFNIKLASVINLALLNDFYEGKYDEPPHECLQALDIILRYGPTYMGIPINSSLYVPAVEDKYRKPIGSGQELAFGYYQSVHTISQGPNLVVDRTSTLFHEAGPVLGFIAKVLKYPGPQSLSREVFRRNAYKIENSLKSLEVKVNHLTYKRRYKVKKVSSEPANKIIIDYQNPDRNKDDVKLSVADFYAIHYNKPLQHPDYPCVVSGSNARPNYIPLELCDIVADQPVKIISAEATVEMIRTSATQKPAERLRVIRESIALSKNHSKPYISEFGIAIRNNSLKVQGRVLEPPSLMYKGGPVTPCDGKWDIKHNKKMFNPAKLSTKQWAIVVFEKRITQMDINELVRQFKKKGSDLGMDFEDPAGTLRRDYTPGCLPELFTLIRQRCTDLCLVVFVVYQSNDLYREIKLVGDCIEKVATQCIHQKNMRRLRDDLFMTNVLLKVNGKLGGVSSQLENGERLPAFLKEERVMTLGIDFTHPSPGERLTASICACVASTDPLQSRWISTVRVNKGNAQVELITELEEMMTTIYSTYAEKNGFFPEKVVVYRDGVSEAQFAKVLSIESKSMKQAYENAQRNLPNIPSAKNGFPKLTFVVVQKRHRTRFVPEFESDGVGNGQNIPPGTCVDSDVIHISDFDFYLASHEGLQGTSRPTHYYVLHDDNDFSADELQLLTYYLSYCFLRCMRSIAVPAPVAYANLVAYRARLHYLASESGFIPVKDFNYKRFAAEDAMKNVLYFV